MYIMKPELTIKKMKWTLLNNIKWKFIPGDTT